MDEYHLDWWNWGWTSITNHLWQSTIFAIIAIAATLLLRRAPAKVRYWIWAIAGIKFLLPSGILIYFMQLASVDVPSVFLSMAWAAGDPLWLVVRHHQFFHVAGSANTIFGDAKGFFLAFGIIWLTGTCAILSFWIRRYYSFLPILNHGVFVSEGREFLILRRICRQSLLKRDVRLMLSNEFPEPGVWGIWRPIILFPASMAAELKDSELEAVLMHEVAHIARWDNFLNRIQMLICSLFWFYPLVWWIDRRMLAERERACDDRVVELGGGSGVYVSGLLKVVQFGLGFKIAGVSCAGGSSLKNRIEYIVRRRENLALQTGHRLILGSVFLAMIGLSVAAVDIGDCERWMLEKKVGSQKAQCEAVKPIRTPKCNASS